MTDARRAVHLGVLAFACVAAIGLSLTRGIWLDEGYSLWFTGRDLGFLDALDQRWMRDAHPPLYYAWCWLLRPLTDGTVATLRLANLGVLLVPALTWWAARGLRFDARFHRLFAMLVASSPIFILYAAELRSYFAMYVLAAALVAQVKLLLDADHAAPTRLVAVMAGTALLLFNVHYLGGLVAGVLLMLLALDRLMRGQWLGAIWPIGTGMAGVVSVGATAAYYLSRTTPGTGHDVGMMGAIVAIGGSLGLALAAAPVAFVVAMRGAIPLRVGLRDRFVVGSLAATALLVAGFLAYNVAQHNLLARYVVGAVPIVLGTVGALASYGCARWPRAEPAIAVAALVGMIASSVYGIWNRRWETNAPAIAAIVADCPTTRVFAISAIPFMQASSPVHGIPGVHDAFRLTYESAAARYGFRIVMIDRVGERRKMDAACPTILWVEHRFFTAMFDDRLLMAAAGLTSPTGEIEIKQRVEGKGRLLLVLMPAGRMNDPGKE